MFSLLEADEPPGFGPPLHIHHNAAEAFYVLEGEYIMFLDGREVSCPAGAFIFIPAGMQHGFRVGSVVSRKLNLYTPAAMVGYFDDLSDAARTGRVDDEALSAIALQVLDGGPWARTRGIRLKQSPLDRRADRRRPLAFGSRPGSVVVQQHPECPRVAGIHELVGIRGLLDGEPMRDE